MEDYLKQAIEIVKAQASVRNMNEDEITSMIRALTQSIRGVAEGVVPVVDTEPAVDPKNAIREKSVICCECGKSFKVLTKRHLATHGLTPEEYREKYGYKKGTSLVAKSLARDRRKTMQGMKLWEKRKKAVKTPA
ncbi:transcriptional regulator, MucR family [Desulfomicrobium apsheronum]|jgi:predicted transcriptional regulator|uniref:Transcriptional regulator, MucR family n=3 Tax=Desulfomicrobium TaxID=898 RepID=A0A1I3VGE4_9BACT|nr:MULTISPECIES: MucR family transcriptional regulator [Desulfomicrobium]MBE1424115.1 putative transcriptional regulator [Desulfomicrobium macestii]MDY0225489.1 MucR family transcriptional regulator [Desulfomicrobium apsheronum]UTF50576.1 MucR family transcriptional regulator [Desulfomicrobium sp. ZS1]SFJ94484.1 transcriptional regulator, MucR family [Desulfomicrobium apsheronum]SFL30637.1 Predicted transcriptional regulator [Desulfomicrobium norvegicum]